MKTQQKYRILFLSISCNLLILLFVYAAISKVLEYSTFKLQLGQSPILTAHSDWLVWFVPLIEMLTVICLVQSNFRKLGLYASLSLMTFFTTYIILILVFSPYIPCSCGGILSTMGWHAHLVFNSSFLLLIIYTIYLHSSLPNLKLKSNETT
ncbi:MULTISPECIES: MauE/DoxX family redox-associated membrane protein [Cellulophaga]|jgi:uncharacterized membrane protein YphA (DoxX/SURF4 family)|uniref:MauE/DoxX family redox-associated membrane protein n=1 Tax=Cellulophaga TaxID=104264 RepID=UPI00339D627E